MSSFSNDFTKLSPFQMHFPYICVHIMDLCLVIVSHLIVPVQVYVILKLTNLPPFPDYRLDLGSFPRCYGPTRPVYIEGLVVAMTRVTKYTQAARYFCENDGCSCSTGDA